MARRDDYDYPDPTARPAQPANPSQPQNPQQPNPQTAPTGTYDRNQFRDAWMGSGLRTPQDLQNFVQQHQSDFGAGVQMIPGGKGDKIRLPDGTLIDAVIGAGVGGQGAGWTGDPSQMGAGGGVGAAGQSPTAGSGSSASGTNPDATSRNNQLLDILMGRAQQSLQVGANDPIIRGQVDAFGAQQERSRRNYLNDLAESSNPYATGAQQTAATQTAEASGQATAGLQAQLMQNELNSRRTEIQNSLSEMGSLLTADQQMSLQRELSQIDSALRQQQINSQNDQFAAQLGLQAADRANYWDYTRSNGGQ